MKRKIKVLIFIVAYNAEKTIESVINRIPKPLFKNFDIEIIIIDDASTDSTFIVSKKIKKKYNNLFKLKIFSNLINQGYGGNQKIGYYYAIKNNFDFVVLLHGDGQYAPEELPKLLQKVKDKKNIHLFKTNLMTSTTMVLMSGRKQLKLSKTNIQRGNK